jgi:hypothetical protein
LQSHPEVCRRKYKKFSAWHHAWSDQHVTELQQHQHNDWMMGRSEGLATNRTHRLTISDLNRTPYRTFIKFKADVNLTAL